MTYWRWLAAAACCMAPAWAGAAELDGGALSLLWGVPFAGILLSIALMPLLAPVFWHHHFGKVAAAWALAFLLPFALVFGPGVAGVNLVHALLAEYVPFVILLAALFTVAGGIYIRGNLHGSPALNTGILALGAVLASFMGTTGASMLLIRPLIRANDHRKHIAHVVVFFIFIVSNAGGSLTPLGDPPLFLGFLKGVDFFWTLQHVFPETLFLVGVLLALFYALDSWFFRQRDELRRIDPTPDTKGFGFDGKVSERLFNTVFEAGLRRNAGAGAQAINDLRTVRDFLSSHAIGAMMDVPLAMLYIVVIFMINPGMGWMSIVGALFQVGLAWLTERDTRQSLGEANRAAIGAQNYVSNSLRNAQVIEAMGMQGGIHQRWLKKQRDFLARQAQAARDQAVAAGERAERAREASRAHSQGIGRDRGPRQIEGPER